jgi:hypothetical protein
VTERALPPACERARLHASVALDGALVDELELEALWHHLGACPACAAFAAELGHAATLVRAKPLESVRGNLSSPRVLRSRLDEKRGPWTSAAIVLVALVFVAVGPPGPDDVRTPPGPTRAVRADGAPLRLPIGQRSAADDFALSEWGDDLRRAGRF